MNYNEFLTKIIDDGIAAATKDYAKSPAKLEGAVGGFNACRGRSPEELHKLLKIANTAAQDAHLKQSQDYWKLRCYAAEIGWVCNCVSALQYANNQKTIVGPTARGYLKMAEVLGIDIPDVDD